MAGGFQGRNIKIGKKTDKLEVKITREAEAKTPAREQAEGVQLGSETSKGKMGRRENRGWYKWSETCVGSLLQSRGEKKWDISVVKRKETMGMEAAGA